MNLRQNITIFLLSCLCALLAQIASGQIHNTPTTRSDTATRLGKLHNGFTYYLRKNLNSGDKILIRFIVKVGHVTENPSQVEFSHIIEHLALRGTTNFPDVKGYLFSKGLKLGSDIFGVTNPAETIYELSISSKDPQLFQNCILMAKDWAQNGVIIDTVSVNAERSIILQETNWIHRMPFGILNNEYTAKILNTASNSWRITADTRHNLKSFEIDSLIQYYRIKYKPELESIIIVGDININSVEQKVVNLFSKINPSPSFQRTTQRKNQILTGESRLITATQKKKNSIDLKVINKFPYQSPTFPNEIKRGIMLHLSANMTQNRVRQRPTTSPVSNTISCTYRPSFNDYGDLFSAFIIETELPNLDKKSFNEIFSVLNQIDVNGFTDEELLNVKKQYQDILNQSEQTTIQSDVNSFTSNYLSGAPILGLHYNQSDLTNLLRAITLKEVSELMSEIISPKNRDIVILAADDSIKRFPTRKAMNKWANSARQTKLSTSSHVVKRPPQVQTDTIFFDAFKSNLAKNPKDDDRSRQYISAINATYTKLSNGISTISKRVNETDDRVHIKIIGREIPNQSESELLSSAGTQAILESSLGLFDREERALFMTARDIKTGYFLENGKPTINISGQNKNIELLFQIMNILLTNQKVDTESFEEWKRKTISDVKRKQQNSPTQKYDALAGKLNGSSPYLGTDTEPLSQITAKKIHETYQNSFYNAQNIKIILSGNYDSSQIENLITKYLSPIPRIDKIESSNEKIDNFKYPKETIITETDSEVSKITLAFPGIDNLTSDFLIKAQIFQDELKRSLLKRLREKEGLSYNPSVYGVCRNNGSHRYLICVSLDCATTREYDAIRYIQQEISSFQQEERQTEYLQDSKFRLVNIYKNNKDKSVFWLEYLSTVITSNLSPLNLQPYQEIIDNTSPSDMADFCRQFSQNNYLLLFLKGPANTN